MFSVFEELIDEDLKKEMLRYIVEVKDKKYIEKLTRELDGLLNEIKKNDPRNLNN